MKEAKCKQPHKWYFALKITSFSDAFIAKTIRLHNTVVLQRSRPKDLNQEDWSSTHFYIGSKAPRDRVSHKAEWPGSQFKHQTWRQLDWAEQRLRMCRDGRGLGSKLVLFAKGFSKHPHILVIFKMDSEYLRFPFKLKVDYFILYPILVSTFVIFLPLFFYEQKKTHEPIVPAINSIVCKRIFKTSSHFSDF